MFDEVNTTELDDLWGNDNAKPEVNRSEDLIREQIYIIEKKTNKAIRGTYSKIEFTKAGYVSALEVIQGMFRTTGELSAAFMPQKKKDLEVLDQELKGKKDINDLYNVAMYKFEIYTNEYRFRILEIINSIVFPIRMVLDEGISEELGMDSPAVELSSNDEVYRFLGRVLQSRKVKNVINQMLVLSQTVNDHSILEYLETAGEATTKQIAEALGWSQSITHEKLSELVKKGKIEIISNEKQARRYKILKKQ